MDVMRHLKKKQYSEMTSERKQIQQMSVVVTVSVRRRRAGGILKLIDRDVTGTGQAGEQKMDNETRECSSVREDEQYENWKQILFVPWLWPLYSDRRAGRSHNCGWKKYTSAQKTHAQARTKTVSYSRVNSSITSLHPKGSTAAGEAAVSWEAALHKGLSCW